jgi:hypothetical protein
MYTKLRKRLDSSPNARCNLTSECIRLITPGSKNVYIDVRYCESRNTILFQMTVIEKSMNPNLLTGEKLPQGCHQSRFSHDWEMQLADGKRKIHSIVCNICATEKQSLH